MGKFQVLSENQPLDQTQPTGQADNGAAIGAIMLALKALSQKTIVALSTLFTAAALASAWYLWYSVLPNPTTPQLVGLGGYAAFILALEYVRRR